MQELINQMGNCRQHYCVLASGVPWLPLLMQPFMFLKRDHRHCNIKTVMGVDFLG